MTHHVQDAQLKTGMTHRRLLSVIQILHCKLQVSLRECCWAHVSLFHNLASHAETMRSQAVGITKQCATGCLPLSPYADNDNIGSAGEDILNFSDLPLQAMAMPVLAVASEVHGEAAAACDHTPTDATQVQSSPSFNLPAACSVTMCGLCI